MTARSPGAGAGGLAPEPAAPPAAAGRRPGLDFAVRTGGLLLFLVYLCIVGPRHEPWFDEAQAWLIARDNDLPRLFASGVRFEGTPALWHLVLWSAQRLGLPYGALWTVSGAFGAAGAALVMFRSPFPTPLRLATVFSYFFAYQYAVVARSYALDLFFAPAAACLFPERGRRPLAYLSILALAANTNAHSFVFSGVLGAEFLISQRRALLARAPRPVLGLALLGLAAVAAALQAMPPRDVNFLNGSPDHPLAPLLHGLQIGGEAFLERLDVFSPRPPSPLDRALGGVLSLALLAPSALLMKRAGRLVLAIGFVAGLVGFSAAKYGNAWHAGIIFLSFAFTLWVSWSAVGALSRAERRLLYASLGALFGVMDLWSLSAGVADVARVYSPAGEIAALIPRSADGRALGSTGVLGFKGFAVQPYFTANIFANYEGGRPRPAYYLWRRSERPIPGVSEPEWRWDLRQGYDRLILSDFNLMGANGPFRFSRDAARAGYCVRAAFPGALIWKTYALETDDMVLYQRCRPGERPPPYGGPQPAPREAVRPGPRP